jgi:hypothetical protein
VLELRITLDRIEHLQSVKFTRHHHVKHDNIGFLLAGDVEGTLAVLGFEYIKGLAQGDAYQAANVGMIINEQNFGHD